MYSSICGCILEWWRRYYCGLNGTSKNHPTVRSQSIKGEKVSLRLPPFFRKEPVQNKKEP